MFQISIQYTQSCYQLSNILKQKCKFIGCFVQKNFTNILLQLKNCSEKRNWLTKCEVLRQLHQRKQHEEVTELIIYISWMNNRLSFSNTKKKELTLNQKHQVTHKYGIKT